MKFVWMVLLGLSLHAGVLDEAIKKSEGVGNALLREAKTMIETKAIIVGGCWNYTDVLFNRAGYPKTKRCIVFRGSKEHKRFARPEQIQAGDWLYYINHSYNDIGHSAMFIAWKDKKNFQGIMLSYGGEKRKKPARVRVYDLRSVYRIVRAQ